MLFNSHEFMLYVFPIAFAGLFLMASVIRSGIAARLEQLSLFFTNENECKVNFAKEALQ
jgi:hypothetical protein